MEANTNSDPRDARRILDAFRRIVQALRLFDRQAEKSAGVSGAAVFVLQKLADGKPVSVNELADRTHTHQSSVSVVAQRLVDRKLIKRQRSGGDARRVELTITPAGKRVLSAMPEAAQDRLIGALARLPAKTRRSLALGLEMLVDETGHSQSPAILFFEERRRSGGSREGRNARR